MWQREMYLEPHYVEKDPFERKASPLFSAALLKVTLTK